METLNEAKRLILDYVKDQINGRDWKEGEINHKHNLVKLFNLLWEYV